MSSIYLFLSFYFITVISNTNCQKASTTTAAIFDCSTLKGCGNCVANIQCFWCEGVIIENSTTHSGKCLTFPTGHIFPTDMCSLTNMKLGVCWVNYVVLICIVVLLIFIVALTIICCLCRCCDKIKKKFNRRRELIENDREMAGREEREARNSQRRSDRQSRYDEIRQKYGLANKNAPQSTYKRFENDDSHA